MKTISLIAETGMFLWVRLVVHDLMGQTTVQELQDALERLPKGLDEA